MTAATTSSDSPVKKKKDVLQQQLYHEPRYSRVKQLAVDVRRTLDTDAAQALIMLFAPTSNSSAITTAEATTPTEVCVFTSRRVAAMVDVMIAVK